MSLLLGLLAVAAYVSILMGVVYVRHQGRVERFGDELAVTGQGPRPGPILSLLGLLGRWGAPVVAWTVNTDARRTKLQRRLEAAGRPGGITVSSYVERKAAWLIIFTSLAILLAITGTPLATIPLLILGWIFVDIDIDGKARRRQARIDKDLPDFLDILAVCVNAGIAFRPAMSRVAEALTGPVGEEITTTLREMSLGASRREAFEALRFRNTSEFVGQFTSAFLQAEELGVPLAEALESLASDMRRSAFQHARRRAQKAAPRVSLIVTFVIMPAAVLLILAAMILGSDVKFGDVLGP
jgi:tight adherence protein C